MLVHATTFNFNNRHSERNPIPRPTEPSIRGGMVECHDMWFEAKILANLYGYELQREAFEARFIFKSDNLEREKNTESGESAGMWEDCNTPAK